MSITKKLTAWTAFSGVLLAAAFASTSAVADSLPTIVDPSFPQFKNAVSIRGKNGDWTITGHKSGQFWFDGFTSYLIKPLFFNMTVSFDNLGVLTSGSISIKGKIDSLGINNQTLMTADLIPGGYEFDGFSKIGFNTTNIVCSSALEAALNFNCTLNESVIIDLDGFFDGDVNAKSIRNSGIAITSVPLPAAVWLLVSGLGLIGVTARRRRKKIMPSNKL